MQSHQHNYNFYPQPVYYQVYRKPRRYGFWKFLFDVTMVLLTQGLWIIYIFVRESRYRR